MNVADSEMSQYPSLQSPHPYSVAFHGFLFSLFQEDSLTLNLAASLAIVQGFPFGWVKLCFVLFCFSFPATA